MNSTYFGLLAEFGAANIPLERVALKYFGFSVQAPCHMSNIINIREAKTHLSRIVDEVAAGTEVIIAKAGKPLAKLSPILHSGVPYPTSWGYTRIQGALANLGHDVSRGTIANVLSEHGVDPAPEPGKHTFGRPFSRRTGRVLRPRISSRSRSLRCGGLVTHYVLFVLDLASRTVKIAGITPHPHETWMVQMARNLTDAEEPFLRQRGIRSDSAVPA